MAAGAPHVTLAAGSDAACLPSQPFMTSAKPHHVPKTPPPNTLLLKVGVPHMNLGGPRASCRVLVVKNLPAMQETQVQSLGWEDPLEEGMATHSSIHAWRIPWTEEPGRLQSIESQEFNTTEAT